MAQKASDSQEKSLFPKFLLSSFSLLLLSLPDPHTSKVVVGGGCSLLPVLGTYWDKTKLSELSNKVFC